MALSWKLTIIGVLTVWALWAATLGFALLLPRSTAQPFVMADLLAGIAFSTVLFGGIGHVLGRVLGSEKAPG